MSPSPEKVKNQGSTVENMQARVNVREFLSDFAEHLSLICGGTVEFSGLVIDGEGQIHPIFRIGEDLFAVGAKDFSCLFLIHDEIPDPDEKFLSGQKGMKGIRWDGKIELERYGVFEDVQFIWKSNLKSEKGEIGGLSWEVREGNPTRGIILFKQKIIAEACLREGCWKVLEESLCRAAGAKSLDEIEFKK